MSTNEAIIDACFAASPNVRYVAVYLHDTLALRSRADLQLLGSNESDHYEEIIVNPTLLKLLTQRGNIDCGGLRHVVVSYGNFDAYILPVPGGHVTVSFEQGIDIQPEIARIGALIEAMAGPAHA